MAAREQARVRVSALRERLDRAARYERLGWARRGALNEDTVLYESFSGNGMLCNPEAIFRALLAADDMRHLRHIWVLADFEQYASTIAEFANNPRVTFVKPDSVRYLTALASAKYVVNNATFPAMFAKREGQVYLNTWHGTPLKAMGFEVAGGGVDTGNVVRNLASADYLLAPNERTAQMYLSGYRMQNLYRGTLIEEGTPRVDRQFASDAERSRLRATLRERGVLLEDNQRVILYAPTWKGNFYSPNNDIKQLRQRIDAIKSQIDTNKYALLLKVHQQVYKFAVGQADLRPILVPNDTPTNAMLAVTDVLITDYSSIFTDFLATGRPVLFYSPDLDDYEGSRGLALPAQEWPGPVTTTIATLAEQINRLDSGSDDDPVVVYSAAYAAARERYCPREDGRASERVVDIVFRGKSAGYTLKQGFSDGRKSVLIYLGGMLPNGITTSALNLLDNMDHDRFDVSVCYPTTRIPERLELIESIHPRVRLFPRVGGLIGPKLQVRSIVATEGRSERRSHAADVERHRELLQGEWARMFGISRFDYIVDFSGYAAYWNKFLLQGHAPSYSIWLHNDLAADADLRPIHRANLRSVFGMYQFADHLVSVSRPLAEVNKTKLSEFAPPEKFTFARNTINYRRILHLAYGVTDTNAQLFEPSARGAITHPEHSAVLDGPKVEEFHPLNLPGSIDKLMTYHRIDDIRDEAERKATIARVLPPEPGVRTFVTVGRLSPEKNQARLIRAFDRIHQEHPDTRLVILGNGPSRAALEELVNELGLPDAVNLVGHLSNPYGVMARADCFVLSSDYEGQPMVLLEALVLGLPVVTTSFGSVRGALPEGYGRVVDRSVGALAKGMRAFLRGEVPSPPFDYVAYNRDATQEFYRAIGAERGTTTPPG